MPNLFPPNYRKSKDTRVQEDASARASLEVHRYQVACEWYRRHLLDVIYKDSPVANHEPIDWTDEFIDYKNEWSEKWLDALTECIQKNIQKEFYNDLNRITGVRKDLVDAFKKLEVILKLEACLENGSTQNNNEQKVENFQALLDEHKSTLTARRREGGALDTFVRMLGVVCAAILGLPVFGVGAYFTAKEAHARLFENKGTTGSEFVNAVSSPKKK